MNHDDDDDREDHDPDFTVPASRASGFVPPNTGFLRFNGSQLALGRGVPVPAGSSVNVGSNQRQELVDAGACQRSICLSLAAVGATLRFKITPTLDSEQIFFEAIYVPKGCSTVVSFACASYSMEVFNDEANDGTAYYRTDETDTRHAELNQQDVILSDTTEQELVPPPFAQHVQVFTPGVITVTLRYYIGDLADPTQLWYTEAFAGPRGVEVPVNTRGIMTVQCAVDAVNVGINYRMRT